MSYSTRQEWRETEWKEYFHEKRVTKNVNEGKFFQKRSTQTSHTSHNIFPVFRNNDFSSRQFETNLLRLIIQGFSELLILQMKIHKLPDATQGKFKDFQSLVIMIIII